MYAVSDPLGRRALGTARRSLASRPRHCDACSPSGSLPEGMLAPRSAVCATTGRHPAGAHGAGHTYPPPVGAAAAQSVHGRIHVAMRTQIQRRAGQSATWTRLAALRAGEPVTVDGHTATWLDPHALYRAATCHAPIPQILGLLGRQTPGHNALCRRRTAGEPQGTAPAAWVSLHRSCAFRPGQASVRGPAEWPLRATGPCWRRLAHRRGNVGTRRPHRHSVRLAPVALSDTNTVVTRTSCPAFGS